MPCRRMRGHACHPVPSLRATLLPCTPATPRSSGSPHPLYSLRTRHRRRRRVVQSLMHAERRRATETALRWLDEAGESSRGGVAAVSRMSQDHNPLNELKGTSPTPTRKGFLLASYPSGPTPKDEHSTTCTFFSMGCFPTEQAGNLLCPPSCTSTSTFDMTGLQCPLSLA